jgi:hypothetical protein
MEKREKHLQAVLKASFRKFKTVGEVVALQAHQHHLPIEFVVNEFFECCDFVCCDFFALPTLPDYRGQSIKLLQLGILKTLQFELLLASKTLLEEFPKVFVSLSSNQLYVDINCLSQLPVAEPPKGLLRSPLVDDEVYRLEWLAFLFVTFDEE